MISFIKDKLVNVSYRLKKTSPVLKGLSWRIFCFVETLVFYMSDLQEIGLLRDIRLFAKQTYEIDFTK